jgi:hypothetical protein
MPSQIRSDRKTSKGVDKTRRRVREMTDPCAFEVDCFVKSCQQTHRTKVDKSPSMPCSCIAATFSSVNPRAYTKKKASAVLRVSRSFISIAMTKRMKRMTKLTHGESSTFLMWLKDPTHLEYSRTERIAGTFRLYG